MANRFNGGIAGNFRPNLTYFEFLSGVTKWNK